MRVLIVGCGYVGVPLGCELARQGHTVYGLRRSVAGDAELKSAGIEPVHADVTRRETLAALPRNLDWVVNCAASSGGDPEAYRQLYFEGNRNLIERFKSAPPIKYVWTSSTSVYGQNDGSWVTESSPTEPPTETGKVLVETEALLLDAVRQFSFPAVILRLAGIYGPERGYWLKQFLRGEARIEGDGSRFLNMIHRDDVAGAIIAALSRALVGSVFNVVDDEPVSQRGFLAWLADQLGRPTPPSTPTDAVVNRKRGVTNKRVSNQRLKEALGYRLKNPTFRQGYLEELAGARESKKP